MNRAIELPIRHNCANTLRPENPASTPSRDSIPSRNEKLRVDSNVSSVEYKRRGNSLVARNIVRGNHRNPHRANNSRNKSYRRETIDTIVRSVVSRDNGKSIAPPYPFRKRNVWNNRNNSDIRSKLSRYASVGAVRIRRDDSDVSPNHNTVHPSRKWIYKYNAHVENPTGYRPVSLDPSMESPVAGTYSCNNVEIVRARNIRGK